LNAFIQVYDISARHKDWLITTDIKQSFSVTVARTVFFMHEDGFVK